MYNYLKDIQELFSNCIITGDKGYIGRQHQINLFETAAIQLEVPLRCNQKEQKPVIRILKKVRKRIETFFSQICDQFMIQRNYAKSFTGFKYRVLAKVTALTILQFLNKFIYHKPVSRVKHALANKLRQRVNLISLFGLSKIMYEVNKFTATDSQAV